MPDEVGLEAELLVLLLLLVPEGAMAEAVANAPTPESAGVGEPIVVSAVARAEYALKSLVAGEAGALMALQCRKTRVNVNVDVLGTGWERRLLTRPCPWCSGCWSSGRSRTRWLGVVVVSLYAYMPAEDGSDDSRLVSVTVRVKFAAVEPATPATKPESKPLASGSQGFANDDWETECLVPAVSKTKVTVSLTTAVIVLGLKKSPGVAPVVPLLPT